MNDAATPRPTARRWSDALAVIKATADTTGGQLTVVEVTEPPGAEAPLHVHHRDVGSTSQSTRPAEELGGPIAVPRTPPRVLYRRGSRMCRRSAAGPGRLIEDEPRLIDRARSRVPPVETIEAPLSRRPLPSSTPTAHDHPAGRSSDSRPERSRVQKAWLSLRSPGGLESLHRAEVPPE